MTQSGQAGWQEYLGQEVVLDMSAPYVYIGQLVEERGGYLVLTNADAHDLRDTTTTREKYVLDTREHGIRPNRAEVLVDLRHVVAISRLADVLTY